VRVRIPVTAPDAKRAHSSKPFKPFLRTDGNDKSLAKDRSSKLWDIGRLISIRFSRKSYQEAISDAVRNALDSAHCDQKQPFLFEWREVQFRGVTNMRRVNMSGMP